MRERARPLITLVAETGGSLVGHILLSPVTLPGDTGLRIMGLAPMAVLPDFQRRGIGSSLVRAGLDACRAVAVDAVVVLGHPEYYPRFGFRPAAGFGIACEYPVPEPAFMLLELHPGCLEDRSGTVKYHPAFGEL